MGDSHKRITGFGCVPHVEGGFKVALIINDEDTLTVESESLSDDQAELFADGYVDGLRASETLTADQIESFVDDPAAIAAMDVPPDVAAADRELFTRGAVGGLKLGAEGYWLDVDETPAGPTH